MKPDATVRLKFLDTSEGGRHTAVRGAFYGCPLIVDDEAFDCRLLLGGQCLELGTTYEVAIKFLSPELALPKLKVGKEVQLWEGKTVARGTVIEIIG